MEETTTMNAVEVIEPAEKTGIIPINDYFNLMPDPNKVAQRAELTKGMLTALMRVVSPCNITDFGGKPYFDHIACERIAKIVGLVIKLNEKDGRIDYEKVFTDQAVNHYTIYLTGRVYYAGREEDYEIQEGSSNSFDDWYSSYQNIEWTEDETGKKHKTVLNANLLPESKVREKARANLIQRLVKKFLGLDFTWEELESAGIERKKCKGFTFSGAGNTADTQEINDLRQNVWKKIVEIVGGDVDKAKAKLKISTAFGDFQGYTDINKVKEKPLEILKGKVDKAYDDYLKKLQKEGGKDNATND